jgi:hypothetical protein
MRRIDYINKITTYAARFVLEVDGFNGSAQYHINIHAENFLIPLLPLTMPKLSLRWSLFLNTSSMIISIRFTSMSSQTKKINTQIRKFKNYLLQPR